MSQAENKTKGCVIVIDGVDGSGKTTQIDRVAKIHNEKFGDGAAISNQEPTMQSDFGRLIREILEHRAVAPAPAIMQYLYYADRLLNWQNVVIPAVEKGVSVYKDRDRTVTCAYGLACGVSVEEILDWHKNIPEPDLYIYLKVSPEEAVRRIAERVKLEGKEIEYFEKEESVRRNVEAFDQLVSMNVFSNMVIVNGEGSLEEISNRIWEEVLKCLNQKKN